MVDESTWRIAAGEVGQTGSVHCRVFSEAGVCRVGDRAVSPAVLWMSEFQAMSDVANSLPRKWDRPVSSGAFLWRVGRLIFEEEQAALAGYGEIQVAVFVVVGDCKSACLSPYAIHSR